MTMSNHSLEEMEMELNKLKEEGSTSKLWRLVSGAMGIYRSLVQLENDPDFAQIKGQLSQCEREAKILEQDLENVARAVGESKE